MAYTIEVKQSAEKELERLPAKIAARIRDAIGELAENPRPRGSKKLKGCDETYRIRVGDYRILYEVDDAILIVLIVEIANRKDAYR